MSTPTVGTAEPWLDVAGRRWPVVEGIPYVRAGREHLADQALDALLAGDDHLATALLLTDRDDWAPTAPPTVAGSIAVIEAVQQGCTLRHAMAGLGFGPVADYFAHRWSDPTFLSGLCLLGEAWPDDVAVPHVVELACGIGQLLAAAHDSGATVTGIDVVFAKLWLARRFVVPDAALWCTDVEVQPLPLDDDTADVVLIHDALYFLGDKRAAVAEADRVGGVVAVGHAHNALVDNWSAGRPLDPAGWSALLPGAACFDDAELTNAWVEGRRPRPRLPHELAGAAAVALVDARRTGPPRSVGQPPPGRPLRLNPLLELGDGDPSTLTPCWPSARYRDEYASLSGYLRHGSITRDVLQRARAGCVEDPDVADLVRHRVLVDLPERW